MDAHTFEMFVEKSMESSCKSGNGSVHRKMLLPEPADASHDMSGRSFTPVTIWNSRSA